VTEKFGWQVYPTENAGVGFRSFGDLILSEEEIVKNIGFPPAPSEYHIMPAMHMFRTCQIQSEFSCPLVRDKHHSKAQ
jgi:hypothetical protein